MDINALLSRLHGVSQTGNGWEACCPAHGDSKPSLSVTSANGKILLHCHRGCSAESIVQSIGLTMADLMPNRNGKGKGEIVQTYDYTDESGKVLFQVCRMVPKDFRQRRPDGRGGWIWDMKDVRRVPYHLPEILRSNPDDWIYICEGEKDVDRLRELGLTASCNVGGAGKWKDEYSEFFKGRKVQIIADNDKPGIEHAEAVAKSLAPWAEEIDFFVPPVAVDEGGDISDLLDAAPSHRPGRATLSPLLYFRSHSRPTGDASANEQPSPAKTEIRLIPLTELTRQYPHPKQPIIDGLLRSCQVMNLIAAPKIGNSWLALSLALSVANGKKWLDRFPVTQSKVLLIDNELQREDISFRAKTVSDAMGLPLDGIVVLPLRGCLKTYMDLEAVVGPIQHGEYGLVIVDAHYRMLGEGISENDNAQITKIFNLLNQLADQWGSAMAGVHHLTKGDQSEKEVTDLGAGAGSQARAADAHVALRKHEQEGLYVVDAAVRSFKPIDPFVLKWKYPLWLLQDSADPSKLDNKQKRERKRDDEEKRNAIPVALQVQDHTANSLASVLGIGRPRCQKLLNDLMGEGALESEMIIKRNNETTVYRVKK